MDTWTPDTVLAELQPIFQEAFDMPELTVTRSSNAGNTPNWDSFAQIALIEMVEIHFNIKLSLGDLEGLKDVGGLADVIAAKSNSI
jgi:acyl carrier protein